MIDGLKPYPSYKDSGEPWLGTTPSHWSIRRLKTMFREVVSPSTHGSEKLLSLRMERGLVDHHALGGKVIPPVNLVGYKRVIPGQIVVNRMRAAIGVFGLAQEPGIVSPDYAVLSCSDEIVAGYYLRLFKTPLAGSVFRMASKGMGTGHSGFMRLYTDQFGCISAPYPSKEEQRAIGRYLSHATRKIDGAIIEKKKAITLLSEQKMAVVHRAITRGINTTAPLKTSGIPWLGDIPQHWTVRRFKFIARINSGQVDPRRAAYRNLILIAPNHIEVGSGRILKEQSAVEQGASSGKYLVRSGQIIYSKIRPNLRKATIAPSDCLCSADMYPMSTKASDISAEYLLLLLLSQPFTKFAVDTSMRVAMPKVNRESLADCPLWFPSVSEQHGILHFIARENAPVDKAISHIEREVYLLREYRTRLVSDIVTGKLDVRAAAASLPAEVDDPLPVALDTDGDDQDSDEDADE